MPRKCCAHGLGGGGAQQVVEDLALAALLAGLELDLAAEHVDRGLQVDDPGDRLVLALRRSPGAAPPPRRSRRRRSRTGRETPERWSTALRLAQRPGEAGQDLDEVVGYVGDQVRLLPDHGDLVVELDRVVGADLGAEPVLERRDDPAAVGVVLGVGAGHHEHVERQPQHVAADLDVALLHHVEHRDLDPLGEVGQLVDRDDAAVAARDQAEVDGLRVAEAAALGHLHRVDVADQVGDARCPGWRASRRTARRGAATPPAARRPRVGGAARRVRAVIGSYGCSPSSEPVDHRRPLVEQADQGAQQPGLALAALAEQHDVVAGEQGPLELGDDGASRSRAARATGRGPRASAASRLSRISSRSVRSRWPDARELADGGDGGRGGLGHAFHATQPHNVAGDSEMNAGSGRLPRSRGIRPVRPRPPPP